MLAHADLTEFNADHTRPEYQYMIDVYGPNRLEGIYHSDLVDTFYQVISELPESFQSRLDIAEYLFGFDPAEDSVKAAELMEVYSPYNYVKPTSPPTLLITGDVDQVVPPDQTIKLKEKLDSLEVPNEIHILKAVNHGFIAATDEQMDSVQIWVTDFITSKYKE